MKARREALMTDEMVTYIPPSDEEQLYVAQALYSALGAEVSTKNPDNLRGRSDARAVALYEADGTRTRNARLNGMKVGTYSTKVEEATPAEDAEMGYVLHVVDARKVAKSAGAEAMERYVEMHADEFARWWMSLTGEMLEGCEMSYEVVKPARPAMPERVTGTVLRIDPKKVAQALGPQLAPAVTYILTDGGEA